MLSNNEVLEVELEMDTIPWNDGKKKCGFKFAKEGNIEEGWPPTNLK